MNFLDRMAVQLYSVRDEAKKDFIGTLEKVAEIGYRGVEFSGFFDTSADELKRVLDRLQIKSVVSHTDIKLLADNLDEVIRYNQSIGTEYIICPWTEYSGREEYQQKAAFFNDIGKKITDAGMKFGYHNHSHEFELVDGKYGLDYLYELTNPQWVIPQLDIYWIEFAGIDPVDYIGKYAGRCRLIHLKDMRDAWSKAMTEVGTGIIDIKGVITRGLETGVEWFTVEQDVCEMSSFESIRISFENLKRISRELEGYLK